LVTAALTAITRSPSAPPTTVPGREGVRGGGGDVAGAGGVAGVGGVAGAEEGAVDSGAPPSPPWATLPVGAPHSQGGGATRPDLPVELEVGGLADLPVALGRRVVRAGAARAGLEAPDAAATDRVLALARAADGARTRWHGGVAVRDGPVIRLTLPAD
jgi:hypothetical protein